MKAKKAAPIRPQSQEKRKYDSDDSRRRLLKAAIDVFSKEGYDGATTRRIAKQAGVNESLIHRYFENKEGLFFAILREFHKHLAFNEPHSEGQTVEDVLTNFFKARAAFTQKVRKFTRIGIMRAIVDSKVRTEMGLLVRNGTRGLVARLEALREEGAVRADVDLEKVSILISGISFSMNMFSNIVFNLESEFTDGVLAEAAKIVGQGLRKK